MIKRIELTGFQSHRHTVLELVPGLNVLVGETNSGKTAVLRAIDWVVKNRPLKPQEDLLSRAHGDQCVVEIETARGVVRREWSKKFNGYELTDSKGKQASYRDLRGDVPPELAMILDLGDINIQDQWNPVFLFNLSPGQVSRYVSELLGFDPVDQAVSNAKNGAQEAARDAARLDAELKEARAELDSYAYLDGLQKNMSDVEAKQARLDDLTTHLDELQRAADEVAARRREVQRLEHVHDAVGDLTDLERDLSSAALLSEQRDAIGDAADAVVSAREALATQRAQYEACDAELSKAREEYVDTLIEMGMCPMCGGDVLKEKVRQVVAG